jgi:hypothetical protein
MIQITDDFKQKAVQGLMARRSNFDGTDASFARQFGINSSVYSRIKKGEINNILSQAQWLNIGRELNLSLNERKWNIAQTDVFNHIHEDMMFCKQYSKSMVMVDDCEIGKTFCARYLAREMKNCFYMDASQAKKKTSFVIELAKTIGVEPVGTQANIKANIKFALKMLPQPLVIIDEAGDLDHASFVELKEFWNATEGVCGWYMMGADGLKKKIELGIEHQTPGYREIFSRFSNNFSKAVPTEGEKKTLYMHKLITDVLSANVSDNALISRIVGRCISPGKQVKDIHGKSAITGSQISGLRRAEGFLILESA